MVTPIISVGAIREDRDDIFNLLNLHCKHAKAIRDDSTKDPIPFYGWKIDVKSTNS